jgi:hypothetical protein
LCFLLFLYVPNSVSVWNVELCVTPAISRNPCLYCSLFRICCFPDYFYMSRISFLSETLNCVWFLQSRGINVLYAIWFCICCFPDCFYMSPIPFRSEMLNRVWRLRPRGIHLWSVMLFCVWCFPDCFYMSWISFGSDVLHRVWLLRSRTIHVLYCIYLAIIVFLIVSICPEFRFGRNCWIACGSCDLE